MIVLVILLTGAAMYVELRLIRAVPLLERLVTVNPLVSLLWSVVLSLVLGSIFGAAGVIVMAAGVLSTALLQPYYSMRRRWRRIRESRDAGVVRSYASGRLGASIRPDARSLGSMATRVGLLALVIALRVFGGVLRLSAVIARSALPGLDRALRYMASERSRRSH